MTGKKTLTDGQRRFLSELRDTAAIMRGEDLYYRDTCDCEWMWLLCSPDGTLCFSGGGVNAKLHNLELPRVQWGHSSYFGNKCRKLRLADLPTEGSGAYDRDYDDDDDFSDSGMDDEANIEALDIMCDHIRLAIELYFEELEEQYDF